MERRSPLLRANRASNRPPRGRREPPGLSGRNLPTRPRSWGLVTIAALLVVGFALAGAVLYSNAGDKASVLALGNQPVAKGQVIQRGDLVSKSVAGVDGAIPVAEVDTVVGKSATGDLVPGQLLARPNLSSDPVPGRGEATVGLALDPARVPSAGLEPGDQVDVIAVPAGEGKASSTSIDSPTVLSADALVFSVEGSSASGGQVLLTVVVKSTDADRVAAYSTSNQVAVIETSVSDK